MIHPKTGCGLALSPSKPKTHRIGRPPGSGLGHYKRTKPFPTYVGPRNFIKCVLIVWMHDEMNMTYKQIGLIFNVGAVTIHNLYHRWYNMAYGCGYEPPSRLSGGL